MSKIKINTHFKIKNDIDFANFSKIAEKILQNIALDAILEVDITFCDSKTIHELNLKYLQKDKPTDVLSFPIQNLEKGKFIIDQPAVDNILLGDIFICYEVAEKQAQENRISTKQEIEKLFGHGLKHLLGFHHK